MDYFKPLIAKVAKNCEGSAHVSAHDKVIKPLLKNALEAYVYKGVSHETQSVNLAGEPVKIVHKPLNLGEFEFLKARQGKFCFDKTRECVIGAENLWNARGFARGSIIILLDLEFDFEPILEHCGDIDISMSPNMSQSVAATKLAKQAMNEGKIAVLFSASNGIEWMQIYAPSPKYESIYKIAIKKCKI